MRSRIILVAGVLVVAAALTGLISSSHVLGAGGQAPPIISSQFSRGPDGWRVGNLPDGGPYGTLRGMTTPTWSGAAGREGGAIYMVDPEGYSDFCFEAPSPYLGDKLEYYGGQLKYDLKSEGTGPLLDEPDVILVGSGLTLVFDRPLMLPAGWNSFTVPLAANGWKFGEPKGKAATPAEFERALSNVTALRINGEFRSGTDTGWLAAVSMEPAPNQSSPRGSTIGRQGTPAGSADSVSLGPAAFKTPSGNSLIKTKEWGIVPANQFGIGLRDGLTRADADKAAQSLGAKVVGEFPYINLYQLEIAGTTEADLRAALDRAKATSGVELAFPLQATYLDADIQGTRCSPLSDSAYSGANGIPYEMIGLQRAWDILRASGVPLSNVHVGIVDTGVVEGTGEFGGKVRFNFPNADDVLSRPDLKGGRPDPTGSHGTAVASVLAADASNGGVAGVASVLEEKLDVTVINGYAPKYGYYDVPEFLIDSNDPSQVTPSLGTFKFGQAPGGTYSLGQLRAVKDQVEGGATIINMSWGKTNADPNAAKAYRAFFEKMAKEHPKVLFVASAGNDGKTLDGRDRLPSGAPLPNMITVGNVLNDVSNAASSNMASINYEVTMAAPGQQVPRGVGPGGKIVNDFGGTSMAAPQVAAAAAILRSINPNLTAGQLKEILFSTGFPDFGPLFQVAKSVGGRVLRVDEAVLWVINDLRAHQDPKESKLNGDDLVNLANIEGDAVESKTDPNAYTVRGWVKAVGPRGTGIRIDLSTSAVFNFAGEATKRLTAPGTVSWPGTFHNPGNSATVTLTRLDSNGCVRIPLVSKAQPLPGTDKSKTPPKSEMCAGVTVADLKRGPGQAGMGVVLCSAACIPTAGQMPSDADLQACIVRNGG